MTFRQTSDKKVAVFLANGFEEIEGLTVCDLLYRAGIPSDTVSITGTKDVTSSHQIHIVADKRIEDIDFDEYDMLVLPGGIPGTLNLGDCKMLTDKVVEFAQTGKEIAAICAAPSVFAKLGLLKGRHATSNPNFKDACVEGGAIYSEAPVIVDGNIITSRGMGTAIDFGFAIVEHYLGEAGVEGLKPGIVWQGK